MPVEYEVFRAKEVLGVGPAKWDYSTQKFYFLLNFLNFKGFNQGWINV